MGDNKENWILFNYFNRHYHLDTPELPGISLDKTQAYQMAL